MCAIGLATLEPPKSTRPAITSVIDAPTPLNGTCVTEMPAFSKNSSPERCEEVPCPPEPKVSRPGLARALSTSSFRFFAGRSVRDHRMYGASATSVIGAKSRIVS